MRRMDSTWTIRSTGADAASPCHRGPAPDPAAMAVMGIEATYRRPRTSVANSEHRIFPYLLRDLEISRTDHVWCADITYIPVTQGFFYAGRDGLGHPARAFLTAGHHRWTPRSASPGRRAGPGDSVDQGSQPARPSPTGCWVRAWRSRWTAEGR